MVLSDFYEAARALSFYGACSQLEGICLLMQHHPDLPVYAAVLANIVRAERLLAALRDELGEQGEELDAIMHQPLPEAVPKLGKHLDHLLQVRLAAPVDREAVAGIAADLATLDRLRACLDAL